MSTSNDNKFTGLVNLARTNLGAEVLSATDDFFAEKENLLNPAAPQFIEGKFTDRGKWMDGWESRRRREPGHDSCIVRICRGEIHGIDIDTAHFTGNYPEQAMVEACDSDSAPDESTVWTEILSRSELRGNSNNLFKVDCKDNFNYLRLNIYPDGGVARLRVYGKVHKDWRNVANGDDLDLAAMENGGVAISCSDMHFGNMWNILAPGRAVNMGDGWETARRRGEGHDWVIVQLGKPGKIAQIEVDTEHFKGNYPASCKIKATFAPGASSEMLSAAEYPWQPLLENSLLSADKKHIFQNLNTQPDLISHVKLEIYPDGGVARFRVRGAPANYEPTVLQPLPLNRTNFKPYGDVIEIEGHKSRLINFGHADRYENLAELDLTDGGTPALSIFRARPVLLPFSIKRMERHPRSSQAFIPKGTGRFLILVAQASETLDPSKLKLFVSNGKQGVNYKRGIWHHFLMALDEEQDFIVIDRNNPDDNTKETELQIPYPIINQFD